MAPGVAGAPFTVTAAVKSCPVTTLAHPTEVIVMVVAPLFTKGMVANVPVTPLNVIEAD